MAYIGSSPTKVVSRQSANIFTYTATANQTAFTGSDANGNTLACTPSDIMVHMNGLRLEESDFTATTTTVTLGSGAAAGDEVTITAFVTFETADAYTKSASDTRYVNTTGDTMSGKLTVQNDQDITGTITHNPSGSGNKYLSLNTASSGDGHILFQRAGSNKYQISSDTSGNLFTWSYGKNGTAFRINADGSVITPYQPAFGIKMNVVNGINATSSTQVISGTTYFNSSSLQQTGGSNFAVGTGRFTAPVSGFYQFNVSIRFDGHSGSYIYITLVDNGAAISRNLTSLGFTYMTLSMSKAHYLHANDYVEIHINCAGDTSVTMDSDSFFSGYLIG